MPRVVCIPLVEKIHKQPQRTRDAKNSRGCIWLNGRSNPCRNLLDFMDVTIDTTGHVVIAYADGCVSALCKGPTGTNANSRASQGTVAIQTGGTPLL